MPQRQHQSFHLTVRLWTGPHPNHACSHRNRKHSYHPHFVPPALEVKLHHHNERTISRQSLNATINLKHRQPCPPNTKLTSRAAREMRWLLFLFHPNKHVRKRVSVGARIQIMIQAHTVKRTAKWAPCNFGRLPGPKVQYRHCYSAR